MSRGIIWIDVMRRPFIDILDLVAVIRDVVPLFVVFLFTSTTVPLVFVSVCTGSMGLRVGNSYKSGIPRRLDDLGLWNGPKLFLVIIWRKRSSTVCVALGLRAGFSEHVQNIPHPPQLGYC